MVSMRIGLIKEGKVPPDMRVALSPDQCVEVMERFPEVEIVVEPSSIRKYPDSAYADRGVRLSSDLSECDILMGIKEVPPAQLIPHKTYLFFSHTFKQQPYNAGLLRAILDKKIRLIDYEVLKYKDGKRLIGFGRYAGIVGAYNGFRAYGLKSKRYELKPAYLCEDRAEMEAELVKVKLPGDFKVVLTGFGRVGHGAREIMKLLPIREVEKEDFLHSSFSEPVFTHLNTEDYFRRKSDRGFDKSEFYSDPSGYLSVFPDFCNVATLYIACHFWGKGSPVFFTAEDMKSPDWSLKVIADVSCDVGGPIPSTIRASKIEDPIYGYHRFEDKECDYLDEQAVAVMAVDNLPCELPKDASEGFGRELIDKVLPLLIRGDQDDILKRASQTNLQGELTEKFAYLQAYADGGTY